MSKILFLNHTQSGQSPGPAALLSRVSKHQLRREEIVMSPVEREIAAVRKAWKLATPEANYRDPQWLRAAATLAARLGKLPKRYPGATVLSQLHDAGFHKALDHAGIVRVAGQRYVILEPYESSCSVETTRRIARELAAKLSCRAWVSRRSWHKPGSTIRITLAPGDSQMAHDGRRTPETQNTATRPENPTSRPHASGVATVAHPTHNDAPRRDFSTALPPGAAHRTGRDCGEVWGQRGRVPNWQARLPGSGI